MSRFFKCLQIIVFTTLCCSVLADDRWTGNHKVQVIDTLDESVGNKALITLEGFADASCSNNRILLTATDVDHYKQMFSVVLSAFHSNANDNIYINSNCQGVRVQLTK